MSNYLLMSDIHLHAWSAFSSVGENGINSRLRIIGDEMIRAANRHVHNGGDKFLVIAGDVFHSRGHVQTSTLNYALDLFKYINEELGFKIFILAGNHDLESNDSSRISSSVTALEPYCEVVTEPEFVTDMKLLMIPWFKSTDQLKRLIEHELLECDRKEFDLILHAPVNDVIIGLPDHGLDAKYLGDLGFKRVFCGHYHNHKDFGNGVYSIGATTHQTFSDVGTVAGSLSIMGDRVFRIGSHAPKFVDIDASNFEDAPIIADGNYVRCTIDSADLESVEKLREYLLVGCRARGVVLNQIKNTSAAPREGGAVAASTPSGALSIAASVSNYVKSRGYSQRVGDLCAEILVEIEGVSHE